MDRRETRTFALVLLLIGMVAGAALTSCGGGGSDGDSNGALCEQCGDTDGPCQPTVETSGNDRPSGCTTDPCTVELRCVRKVDSGQRRCFPVDPSTDQLDFDYKCDGSRPIASYAPTLTPSASPTPTPEATVGPTSTGPTATAATPTSTAATPTATATPSGPEDSTVTITVTQRNGNDVPAIFSVTVSYPSEKGNFLLDGAPDCDEGDYDITDNGTGTLLLSFIGEPEFTTEVEQDCTFHQTSGAQLRASELSGTTDPILRLTFEVN